MQVFDVQVNDPATKGWSNAPTLQLSVGSSFDEEWKYAEHESLMYRAGAPMYPLQRDPKYYIGRAGSDQYTELTVDQLAAFKPMLGTPQMAGKAIWVVFEQSLEYAQLGEEPRIVTALTFSVYHADDCIKYTGHGAYYHEVNDDLTLVNGWSSNFASFNETGIKSEHYMGVDLVTREGRSIGSFWQIPVHVVANFVRRKCGRFYSVQDYQGLGHRNWYTIERTLVEPLSKTHTAKLNRTL